MAVALARHNAIIEAAVGARGGVVFATGGDGFAVAFHRATDAVVAAVEAQRRLGLDVVDSTIQLRVRIGIHTGDAVETGSDYLGTSVNVAARLMAVAAGGQIVVSQLSADLAGVMDGVKLRPIGGLRLRGIARFVPACIVAGPGLDDNWSVSSAEPVGRLVEPSDEFVGRRDEVAALAGLLRAARLVTVTGVGGVGKTRLAVETSWTLVDEFPDGVWLVELGPIVEPDSVGYVTADTLGATPEPGGRPVDTVVARLRGKRALLILDNCEHVLDAVRQLAAAVVGACSTVRVLATSREVLGLGGEHVHAVRSLDVAESVELFSVRALARDDRLSFSADDRVAIAQIGGRLDGIPLALELAASRSRTLGVAELLERLEDRFRYLRGASGGGGLARHQTLRAAVGWSYQLLDDVDRTVFDRLAAFPASFDLAAAEAVVGFAPIRVDEVVEAIARLVDKSMVIADTSVRPARYRLLETLRQFGEERLDDAGAMADMRWRCVDHYLGAAERARIRYEGRDALGGWEWIDREWDNLRAAHQWALAAGDVERATRIVVATAWFAYHTPRGEHADWVAATMALPAPRWPWSVELWAFGAWWAVSDLRHEDAIDIARRADDLPATPDRGTLLCATALAMASFYIGRADQATTSLAVAATLAGDDPAKVNYAGSAAAGVHYLLGDTAATIDWAQRQEAAAEHFGSPMWQAMARTSSIAAALALGDVRHAAQCSLEARALATESHMGVVASLAAGMIAGVSVTLTDDDVAAITRDLANRGLSDHAWQPITVMAEPLARHFAARGDLDSAGITVGFHLTWNRVALYPQYAHELSEVETNPTAQPAINRGRRMSREQFAQFLLDRFAE